MFYFSLKCYSEDIDEEALLFGTPMYIIFYRDIGFFQITYPDFCYASAYPAQS